jgi:hypothetical protein
MSRLLVLVPLLLGWVAPCPAQTAFINEFHTDDANGGYIDYDGDGSNDAFTDLEFVEFALNTDAESPYDASDIVALFYDGSGTYADFAIGPSYWTEGQQQGPYTLYSYGPFGVSLALAPQNPPRGALPDGEGAIALTWWDEQKETLHLIDMVSYGDTVSTTNDPYIGSVTVPPIAVNERPAPASDTSDREFYSLGLTGVLGTAASSAGPVGKRSSRPARPSRPPLLSSPDTLLSRIRAAAPAKQASPASTPPEGLEWTVLANTASPGRPNSNQSLPVDLVAFDAVATESGAVLRWSTASEARNAGFYVEHAHHSQAYAPLAFVQGAGTSDTLRTYRHRVDHLAVGTHWFRLRQVDLDGAITYTRPVQVRVRAPAPLTLSAPAPSPFRTRTTVTLTATSRTPVTVAVFDVVGRRVATLWNGPVAPNEVYELSLSAAESDLSPGVYLIRAQTPERSVTRKAVLVR